MSPLKIQPIAHTSLTETAAGKLSASILDGTLSPGTQLPPERELMSQLGISRSTLREALKFNREEAVQAAAPNYNEEQLTV